MLLGLQKPKKTTAVVNGKMYTLRPWTIRSMEWASEAYATPENQNGLEVLHEHLKANKPEAVLRIFHYLIDDDKEQNFDTFAETAREWQSRYAFSFDFQAFAT